jgi:hypothetical protein
MNNDSGVASPTGGANLPIINPNAPTNGIQPADLMSEISSRLLSTSGAISSSNSKIEDVISGAIKKTQESGDASKAAAGSQFDRAIGEATDSAARGEQGFLEGQRGFATNVAALRDLRTSNEKGIKDLLQRKEEVMLQGDADTASKISGLILQKYQFQQEAEQKVFSNLTTLANFGMQQAQEKRLAESQAFTEEQGKSQIALQYGIEVKPGDTFTDVVNRAKPLASAEQKLQLDKMTADIQLTKQQIKTSAAQAVAALKESKKTTPLGPQDIQVVAQQLKDSGMTANAIKSQLATSDGVTDKSAAYGIVDTLFATPAKAAGDSKSLSTGTFDSPLLNTAANFGQGAADFSKSITDFIFGKDKFFGMSLK